MEFNRWVSSDSYSYVYRLFSRYHRYMNSIYWSYVPATEFAQGTYRRAKKENSNITTHEIFKLGGEDAHRVTESIKDWSKYLKEFDNWARLNALVAANSYLEMYMSSITSLAIESDLGLLYSISKKIDGITVLKYGGRDDYSFYDKSEEVTKGEWSKRIKNYKLIFGSVPQILYDNEGNLQKMRRMRNNIAHAFGRDIDLALARGTTKLRDIDRLSLRSLKKYMKIVMEIAKGIDKHLLNEHIGEFELIHFYHITKDTLNKKEEVKDFKGKLNSLYVQNKNHNFCSDLIQYYKKL